MNVVVCDDHRLLAECLSLVLEARGHRVIATVNDPDEAVRIVTDREVDVCVMDLSFPDASGFDAIDAISRTSPGTQVVVLSGSSQPFAEMRAIEAGAAAFVLKDDDVSRLIDVVEQVYSRDGTVATMPLRGTEAHGAVEQFATRLTAREREVLQRLVSGERTQAIAAGMGVSYSTARTHVQNVLHKLGVHSRLEAVAFAMRHSLVPVGRNAG
jgi:two-component system nitrate/nitrite response regulator NarL